MLKNNYSLSPTKNVNYLAKSRSEGLRHFFASQRFLALVIFLALILVSWPLAKNYSRRTVIENEIKEAEEEISKYENDNQALKEMINYLESDQAVEDKARLNLGLKMPGEKVVVITDQQKLDQANLATVIAKKEPEKKNWQKWFYYFFK